MKISFFGHAHDGLPRVVEMSWDDFVSRLGPHRLSYPDKISVPMFSPCLFVDGMPRRAQYALSVGFGVLDLDDVTPAQVDAVIRRLDGLDVALYTTWQHALSASRGLWRLRVLVRLSRAIERTEWPAFRAALVAHCGAISDSKCNNIDRCYFAPAAPPGTHPDFLKIYVIRGAALDVDALEMAPLEGLPAIATEKVSRDRLERLAQRWKRDKSLSKSELGIALQYVVKGEKFAEKGHADTTLFRLCSEIVQAIPDVDPESLAAHFAQSLQIMGPHRPGYEDEILHKITRAQNGLALEAYSKDLAADVERKMRIREAFAATDPTRQSPYTTDEINAMASECKCTPADLRKRWIVQRGPIYYVLGPEATYSPPYGEEVHTAILRDLAPAETAGVNLWIDLPNGERMRKSLPSTVGDYGSVATDYVVDMRAQKASYDSCQKLFIEAPCPLRALEPAFDPEVAKWYETLFGDHLKDALTWLALLPDLREPMAALLLTGKKDTGKTLFFVANSRLWSIHGPTTLESALGNWNDCLAKCPLVFADERLPTDFRGYGRTDEIREFISARARPYKKRYAPEASILGSVRLGVASNNDNVLKIKGNLSAFDIEAIGDRFYRIEVRPEAALHLYYCNTDSFVNGDRVAKHTLWLRDHHPVVKNGRFQIRSSDQKFYQALSTQTGIRSAVCQWFLGYLRAPKRIDTYKEFGVVIRKNHLYVRPETVLKYWDSFILHEKPPAMGDLTEAIGDLSDLRTTLVCPEPVGKQKFRRIITDHLVAWAERCEVSGKEEIDLILGIDTEDRNSA